MEHATLVDPTDPWYLTVRELALALPGALEKVSHGRPAFHTQKVFAYYGGAVKVGTEWVQHPRSVVLQADLDGRHVLRSHPAAYVPGYLGPSGWTGLDLDDRTDLADLADWLRTSFEVTAPARLLREARQPGPLQAMLGGGEPRSLAGVEEVLAVLRSEPGRLTELIDCCSVAEPVVRMRAADALEKFARERPELVVPHLDRLEAELSTSTQPSIQWHLAQLWGGLPLTPAQRQRAAAWLLRTLDEASDWIVLTSSMSALAALAGDDPDLEPPLRQRLERHAGSRLKSVAKRADRLLAARRR
jgi:predicted DNA-binding protein (MmcQ/YjbR family)